MKIDKALEILEHWQKGGDITSFDDVNTSVKLGIEALKRIKADRFIAFPYVLNPLSGETPEGDS